MPTMGLRVTGTGLGTWLIGFTNREADGRGALNGDLWKGD